MSGYIGIRRVPTTNDGSGIFSINEQAKFKKDGIWPYGDPYFANVSLLLHFDGTNNSTTFTDSSLNNLTVTRNGDAKISTAQSKFGGSSGYFDGTGDYLTLAGNAVFSFPGAVTIEMFVYFSSFNANGNHLWGSGGSGSEEQFVAFNNIFYYAGQGFTYPATMQPNTWHHLAVARDASNTLRGFLDGSLLGSPTKAGTLGSATTQYIGRRSDALNAITGYIDELRITKGVARYASGFTPPATPFPSN